jgi:hypothetical protein
MPPGKWAVRLMSYLEVLLSKDVSETLSKVLVEFPPASDQILRVLLPGKCLVRGFRALFRDWNGGGANIRQNEKHGRDTGEPIGSEALHDIGTHKATRLAIPQVAKRIRSRESVVDVEPQKLEPGKGKLAQEVSPEAKKSRTRGALVDEV